MAKPTRIECACTSLKMAGRVVGRAYDAALEPLGLNVTQYAILANVGRHQPISQIALAERLELERTTLYRAVALLERDGWLRARPLGQGLAQLLELTPRGAALTDKARARWQEVQARFVASFGKRRWQRTLTALEEIRAHFAGG